MPENIDKFDKSLLKKWLDKLQQESWQLELLISGFAIFGLFSLKDFLSGQLVELQANMHADVSLQTRYVIVVSFAIGTMVFITNLVVHVIVRGLWIGAIGLRYVSGDIEYKELNYSDRFIKYYKRVIGSFDNYIIGLEKFASVVFSYTFLLLFVFFSFFLFYIELMLLYNPISKLGEWMGLGENTLGKIAIIFVGVLGVIVAFDFVTLGLIKRIKQRHFSKVYFVIYKIIGFATLSFLWRPLLLNFLDNKYTRRLLFFIVPYIFVLVFILPGSTVVEFEFFPSLYNAMYRESRPMTTRVVNRYSYNQSFYDSMTGAKDRDDDFHVIREFSVPSNKVRGDLFEIFIKHNVYVENIISRDSSIFKVSEIGYANVGFSFNKFSVLTEKEKKQFASEYIDSLKQNRTDFDKNREKIVKDSLYKIFRNQNAMAYEENLLAIKRHIKQSFSLSIDGNPVPRDFISCDFYVHPNAGEKGVLCFFPIDLEKGRHELGYKRLRRYKKSERIDTVAIEIPFIYTGK